VESAPDAVSDAAVAKTGNGTGEESEVLDLQTPTVVMESIRVDDAPPIGTPGPEREVRVEIKANTSLNYTSYEPDSSRFVLEIPNVDLSALPGELSIGRMGVSRALITAVPSLRGGSHARIEFIAEGPLEAHVIPRGRTLTVTLRADDQPVLIGDVDAASMAGLVPEQPGSPSLLLAQKPAAAAPATPPVPATAILGVVAESGGPGARIAIIGDGTLVHRHFTLANPDRVVVDIVGVVNDVPEKIIEVGHGPVSRVRIAQFRSDPEKVVRVVLDLTSAAEYEIVPDGYGLLVHLGEAVAARRAAETAPVVAAAQPPTPSHPEISLQEQAPSVPAPAEAIEEEPLIEISVPVPASPAAAAVQPASKGAPQTVQSLPELETRAVPSSPKDLGRDVVLFDRAEPETATGTSSMAPAGKTFESQSISTGEKRYRGEKISVTFRDADIREVFFFFADLMKMNLVLDPDITGRIDIRLRQVPWDQAFYVILKNQGLDAIEEENVIRIAKTAKLRQEAAERRALKQAKEQEVDPITFTRRLSYAKTQEALTVLTQVKSDRGKIIADIRTNTIIIMDIPEKRAEYENLINALDLQTPQVSIEARIVEATRDFQRSLGIDWSFNAAADTAHGTQTNLDFPHNATIDADVNLASTSNAGTLGIALGNVLDSVTLDVTLDAFEADGKVRVLSAPKIVTQNNQSANIEQGTQIPVVTTTATEIEVQYVPASLRLMVTPQITAEDTVIMKVIVENNQPSDTLSVGDTPAIVTERVDTQILVRSGTTAVIGGVYKLQESDSETGIPGLRRIPFLGWLFKNKQFQKSSAELLVCLTPKIIATI